MRLSGADLQAIDLYRADKISWQDVTPQARLFLLAPEMAELLAAFGQHNNDELNIMGIVGIRGYRNQARTLAERVKN